MNPFLRTFALILALGCGVVAGCKPTEPASPSKVVSSEQHKTITIGVSLMNLSSEFIVMINAAIEKKAKELGVKLLISGKLNGQGNLVMMHGFLGQAAQIKREAGAKEILAKQPGLKMLADQTAEWDRAKALTLMENWIQSLGLKINAVFAQNDEMGLGALIALENARMKDKVIVVSVDSIADALQAVKKGRLDATVFQDASDQGGTAVETAVKIVRKQTFDRETFIPFQLVTKANVDQYLKK